MEVIDRDGDVGSEPVRVVLCHSECFPVDIVAAMVQMHLFNVEAGADLIQVSLKLVNLEHLIQLQVELSREFWSRQVF